MSQLTIAASDGSRTQIDEAAIETLAGGEVINAASPEYDAARAVWNAMIDMRPGLIVRCLTSEGERGRGPNRHRLVSFHFRGNDALCHGRRLRQLLDC